MAQPNVREQMASIDRDGRSLPVYISEVEKNVRRPAVIIVHEIFGLNDHIKDIARRFADRGFIAFAPDLFAGAPELPADRNDLNAMRTVWQNIPDSRLIEDMQAVYAFAAKHPNVMADKVGTIGYCMGGAIAYMFACSTPKIAWVADYYGRIFYPELSDNKPKHPIDYTSGLRSAVLGIFAGKDPLITPDQIAELKRRLEAKRTPYEIKVYEDAKHAFFNDQREFYDQAAAKDAWQRTLDFVSQNVRLPGAR